MVIATFVFLAKLSSSGSGTESYLIIIALLSGTCLAQDYMDYYKNKWISMYFFGYCFSDFLFTANEHIFSALQCLAHNSFLIHWRINQHRNKPRLVILAVLFIVYLIYSSIDFIFFLCYIISLAITQQWNSLTKCFQQL